MRRVRRKIEVNPDQPRYIVTVRGSGYRFRGADGWIGDPAPPASRAGHDRAARDGPLARSGARHP